MKNWRSALVGFVAGIFVTMGSLGVAAPITGPLSFPDFAKAVNATFLTWFGFVSQGELTLSGPNAFAPLGTVATAMSSLGPVGSHTTVQRWMVVINPGGTVGFVPVF
jgi:hypothetical protein